MAFFVLLHRTGTHPNGLPLLVLAKFQEDDETSEAVETYQEAVTAPWIDAEDMQYGEVRFPGQEDSTCIPIALNGGAGNWWTSDGFVPAEFVHLLPVAQPG